MAHSALNAAPASSDPRGWRVVIRPILLLLLFSGIFIILPAMLLPRLGFALTLRERTAVALGGTLLSELLLFALMLRWLRARGRTLAMIGWGRPTSALAIAVGIIFALGYALFTLSNPLIRPYATELSLFKLAGALVGVIGALVEECVFRGYIITELERMGKPVALQILVSGLAFAAIHTGFNLIGIVFTCVLGIVLAGVYILGKRSLTPSIISHALINLLIEPWLLLFIVSMYAKLAGH